MTEYARLVVSVDSRPVRQADGDLTKLSATAGRTEKATEGLGSAFRRLAGPLAAVLSVRQIAQAAESYTNLTNRLRNVTDSSEELVAAQEAVFAIAQGARQPLDATAELYQRIATNADALGLSASAVTSIVDTVNKSLAISGTSAQSAAGALTQLGQAFASGQLRGEELNAVLENAPALAKTLADGLGVTVGELRKLGAEGKLSAESVAQALIKQGDAVDKAFGNVQATAGQAFTVLGNSLTRVVGEIDAATGASSGLADSITKLSEFIDSGALTLPLIESFAIWGAELDAISADFTQTFDIIGDLLDDFEQKGSAVASSYSFEFKNIPADIRAAVRVATVELASLLDNNINQVQALAAAVKAIPSGLDAVKAAYSGVREQAAALGEIRQESIDQIFAERDASVNAGESARQRYEDERKVRAAANRERAREQAQLREGLQGQKIDLNGAADAEKAAKKAAQEAKKLQAEFERAEEQLRRQIVTFGQVTEEAEVFYEVQQGGLRKISDLQKERLLDLAKELDLLKANEQLKETERFTEALNAQVEARRRALDIEIEGLGVGDRQRKLLEDISNINEKYAEQLRQLADEQGRSNALTEESYQRRVEAIKAAQEEEVRIVQDAAQRKAEAEQSWQAGANRAIQNYADDAANVSKQVEDSFTRTFGGMEDALVDFVKTGKLDFTSLADSIISDLIRIAARQAISGLFSGAASAGASPAPAAGASGGNQAMGWLGLISSFAGLFDRGGPIPAGGWGIVGENGPEIVRGPAQVTGREETARMMGGNNVQVGQMVFPGVTNAAEARKATAAAAREIGRLAQGSARYM